VNLSPARRLGSWMPRGLRIRLTAVCALIAAVLTVVGSAVFLLTLQSGVRSNLDNDLDARLAVLVSELRQAGPTGPTGLSPLLSPQASDRPDSLSAFRRPDGSLLSVSGGQARGLALPEELVRTAPGSTARVTIGHGERKLRLVAEPVRRGNGVWLAIAGTNVHDTDDVVHDVAKALLVVAPLIVVLAAIGSWMLAGAALRPVERLRRDASALATAPQSGRLQVPATGDELASLADTLNELLERLQRSLARQQEFVADAGHELRTPLAVLRMELDLASRPGRSREELADAVQHAAAEAARLSDLADAMLFLARADGGAALIRTEPTSLVPLLSSAARAIRARADLAGVSLFLDVDDDLAADIDPSAVRRAVDNLLANAVEHTPAGRAVLVSAASSEDRRSVVIDVDDEGTGFPPAFLPQAFERFQRADAARSHASGQLGAGLGLAIVAEVAAAHGGTAGVSNRPSGGARARLILPGLIRDSSPLSQSAASSPTR
jgi:two-component system, OmpR family, sensor kinase